MGVSPVRLQHANIAFPLKHTGGTPVLLPYQFTGTVSFLLKRLK